MGYKPVNRYLPPRPRRTEAADIGAPERLADLADRVPPSDSTAGATGLLGWLDQMLSR
jgi:hypothetical protein